MLMYKIYLDAMQLHVCCPHNANSIIIMNLFMETVKNYEKLKLNGIIKLKKNNVTTIDNIIPSYSVKDGQLTRLLLESPPSRDDDLTV